MNLDKINNIYFVGIGGIGMSALAKYFLRGGKNVKGYDRTPSGVTKELEALGIKIDYENQTSFDFHDAELIIYTPAVSPDSAVRVQLKNTDIPQLKRARVLGIITENNQTAAVAGTHGKTTTCAILAQLLYTVTGSVTAFIGGKSANFKSNFVYDENAAYTVIEADEYDRSFLHLSPHSAIITSVDADHLDIYGSQAEMHRSFHEFADLIEGPLLINDRAAENFKPNRKFLTYGFTNRADFQITDMRICEGNNLFNLKTPNGIIEDLICALPGKHNVENASAAVALCSKLFPGETAQIKQGLETFKGVERRFETLAANTKGVYIDDYAHHPREIQAAVSAAEMMHPGKKITVVFQPHLFSRTADFMNEFASVLSEPDTTYLLEIYPAREKPIHGVSSAVLTEKINTIKAGKAQLITKNEICDILKKNTPQVLLSLGAGDISDLRETIKREVYS